MKIRTTKPKAGNKYYNNSANGGWSWCVTGQPTDRGCNVLSNCVGYASGRFNEIYGRMKFPKFCCNAENFIEVAKQYGLKISKVPVQGGIMVWQKGSLNSYDGAGHVAIVEKVYSNGTILTSESGWNCNAFWTAKRTNNNGRWGMSSPYSFRGCIVNPAVKPTKHKVSEDGVWGVDTTIASQTLLGTYADGLVSGQLNSCKKFLPNAHTSSWKFSIWGGGSLFIKALQRFLKTTADGWCGKDTVKALQKFLIKEGLYNGTTDGIMGNGTVKGWQKYLNRH